MDSFKRKARAAQTAEALAATEKNHIWYEAELAKLEQRGLTGIEKIEAATALKIELVHRHKAAENRARRNNTPAKLIERALLDGNAHSLIRGQGRGY